ncbi:uncharacterized protein Z518_02734 [Rhinocladiella mackenziei CBS 650.93]|uniref:Uncharacterized protein n=1 Tax=Rhinocladiella mackenziei CBS 650.93 TaxID=1442369 RepID=A0A0D2IQA6_9EURO|nr:uncharacterized protein Z518_02734 [Rhinocladiella mackenziei CBS 650.93]KIX08079.1 hypothetical protein Z518_02734 [Rhinocladiella mackenziei CBS 650.93]
MAEIEKLPLLQNFYFTQGQSPTSTTTVFTAPQPDSDPGWTTKYTHAYPWLGPEYSNGILSFETHFQDYEIENPAVILQEALGELWKRILDGIKVELESARVAVSPMREERCGCQV